MTKRVQDRQTSDLFKQINENEYVFVSSYNPDRLRGTNFTLEHFEGEELQFKIFAQSIRWMEEDSLFRMINYGKRTLDGDKEYYEKANKKDTLFDFEIQELAPLKYTAETLQFSDLNRFIEEERKSGSVLINNHLLVRHKRYSLPLSAFVLTIIAVAVSSFKRRGGMGVNLAFGIGIGFTFIFFDKIFGVLVNKSNFHPAFAAWIPIAVFSVLALYLLNRARK